MKDLVSVEILARLVAMPTVSRNSNTDLINWVREYLERYGVRSVLVPNADRTKFNLHASIGPPGDGGIVLSGHTDVVPTDDQRWSSDPFVLTARDGVLHGRGTADMKGFIATVLALVPEWTRARLERPVHIALSYDEELGCLGVPSLIESLRSMIGTPRAVIVGEPTGLQFGVTHKGIALHRTTVTSRAAHSSLTHLSTSAVVVAGELIAGLSRHAERLLADRDVHDGRFDPPCTTLSVNQVRGGIAFNTLAEHCEFWWDVRALPGSDTKAVRRELQRLQRDALARPHGARAQCSFSTEVLADVPPLEGNHPDLHAAIGPAFTFAQSIALPFAAEAGFFERVAWPTVVFGPGNIEQAHAADEFVPATHLTKCAEVLRQVVYLAKS